MEADADQVNRILPPTLPSQLAFSLTCCSSSSTTTSSSSYATLIMESLLKWSILNEDQMVLHTYNWLHFNHFERIDFNTYRSIWRKKKAQKVIFAQKNAAGFLTQYNTVSFKILFKKCGALLTNESDQSEMQLFQKIDLVVSF